MAVIKAEHGLKRTWLKQIREGKKLTQAGAAMLAGIPANYYNMIENGVRGANLPAYTAKKIAKALGFEWTRFYESERV